MTVKVVTDSSCDLPQELADEHGITIVPLSIRFGDEEFVDRQDLTPDEFWSRVDKSPTLPETSAPSPGAFEQAFRAAAAEGHDGVVAVLLSGGLSATVQSAELAAEAVKDTIAVKIIDTRQASAGVGLIALNAAKLAEAGKGLEDVSGAAAEQVGRTVLYATFDTLDNLRKGGRIGRAQALFGSVLSMKPVIELIDGVVEAESRQRTRSKSLRHLADKVGAAGKLDHLVLIHADAPDFNDLLVLLEEFIPRQDIIVTKIGAVIGTHSGPRAMGVVFQISAS
ncbi:MAG: DegV family protein [Acidimicrobiales bacterium]